MSYDEAKIKYIDWLDLSWLTRRFYLAVIYDKKNHTPVKIYLINTTNAPLSVSVDGGFFCEDLYSQGEGITKTFVVPADSHYLFDEFKDGGELDFTNWWHLYIRSDEGSLYKLNSSFSGRIFWNEGGLEKNKLEFETDNGLISDKEAGYLLKWDFAEKIKSGGKLLVPPLFYFDEDNGRAESHIKDFLENPSEGLQYLKTYGFATGAEVKEALEKIPEAIEKKKVEMGYKFERLKKLQVIKKNLTEKMNKLKPKIGDIIYLETENEMGDLILGGKAKISHIENGSRQVFIKVEGFPELTYGWHHLQPKQRELEKKFGEQWFHRYEPNIIKNDAK
jgi:hypothetical protein